MPRPRIALAPCFFHADPQRPVFKGKTLLYLEESLAHWVERGGAIPLLLPTPAGEVAAEELLEGFDGLLLQGGSDVCPGSYGEEPLRPEWCGDPVRDAYEIALVRACMAAGRPVLGVCRGMQVLNVALGGTLWQDIVTQNPGCRVHRDWQVYDQLFHEVRVDADSWLAGWVPGPELRRVNSVHHQGVRTLGRGLVAEAASVEDAVVEAVRYDPGGDAPFAYGVQWHPEFQDAADASLLDGGPILGAFLRACEAAREAHSVGGGRC